MIQNAAIDSWRAVLPVITIVFILKHMPGFRPIRAVGSSHRIGRVNRSGVPLSAHGVR